MALKSVILVWEFFYNEKQQKNFKAKINSMNKSNKLWSSELNTSVSELMSKFNDSFSFDWVLWDVDILGSLVHAEMLSKQNIINKEDWKNIKAGLLSIAAEIEENPENWKNKNINFEDIHTAIETNLTEKIGEAGKRLHTARSRNDQVATDIRLWLRRENQKISNKLLNLLNKLIEIANRDADVLIPGYTHLQQAQPIALGHHWLAHYERFSRDFDRLQDNKKRFNYCPLGSGALAGTTYNIDREFTAKKLGFIAPTNNSLDSVSDRDFIAEFLFTCSMIGIHISQIAEELIIWSSSEYRFIKLPADLSTGSSMMPQKRNPDVPELLRGKSGRLIGNLQNILFVLKALPLAYNKDLQEDKESLFDTCQTITICLDILTEFLPALEINQERINEVISKSFLNATDLADYLVKKGIAFRDAYKAVGDAVKSCTSRDITLSELSLEELKNINNLIEQDVYKYLDFRNCMENRKSLGGTANSEVYKQINLAEKTINNLKEKLKKEIETDPLCSQFSLT